MVEKRLHEIRDPIHAFIRFSSTERKVINSRPLQRLRSIHQLALTYLVYPGATHKRFEHSLGVMELADRVYGVITNPENLYDNSVRSVVPTDPLDYAYWRRVLRMAALCHDVGHLPFSHAAEKELLPDGWTTNASQQRSYSAKNLSRCGESYTLRQKMCKTCRRPSAL